MRSFLHFTLFVCLISLANAQVKTNFNNQDKISAKGIFFKNFRGKNPLTIPARNIKALLHRDSLENRSGEIKPFKIAEAVEVDINVLNEAEWIEQDGFAYGIFTIVAASAKSISVNFDQFYLPVGSEMFVYSESGEMITGPITDIENNKDNFWGSWVYKGGKLTVDLKIPVKEKSSLKLHLSSIGHGYKDLYVSDFGSSSSCNVNVLCLVGTGWENQRNSVALILNGNSTQVFSGALINNTCNLNIPYLLTANHAFEATPDVAQWKFNFQAWSATCTPSQNSNGLTFNGSTLRARNAGSDFCLLELNQVPPANSGITLSGWSRANTASPSGASITHPHGDVMKIATFNQTVTQQLFSGVSTWSTFWASGTVEPGSSGGPLYNNNRQIIGQLTGGNQSDICTSNDHAFFGRFDISWTGGGTNSTRLSNWLDPGNTGALTTNARGIGIMGSELICSTANYTFIGPSVTWASSNPSGLSIDPITGAATRTNNFNGNVTITATFVTVCGNAVFSKTVWVGSPIFIGGTVNTSYMLLDGTTSTGLYWNNVSVGNHTLSAYRYGKTSSGVNTTVTFSNTRKTPTMTYPPVTSSSSADIATYSWFVANQGDTYTVNATTSNTCGSNYTVAVVTTTSDPNPARVRPPKEDVPLVRSELPVQTPSIFPNPSNDSFSLALYTDADGTVIDGNLKATVELILYNNLQQVVYRGSTNKSLVTVSTAGLQTGAYYLQINHSGGVNRKQVLVK